jgi:hypothetical protein
MIYNKLSVLVTKVISIAFALLLLVGITPAMAARIPTPPLTASIGSSGSFMIDTSKAPPGSPPAPVLSKDATVRSAVLAIPNGETGFIEKIKISAVPAPPENPSGIVYGCLNIKVKNKIDLIESCGGPAVLKANVVYKYEAIGKGFKPNSKFAINLFDGFGEGK